ncbi:MAG TPA: glycosyltransferase family 2 protein [Vicinamibacterales bacterium]|nr:glycosyltransferase family 2 protein [Vicinamibacterales bacterium]
MYTVVGREISRITRYADRVVHLDPVPGDSGLLLAAVDAPLKSVSASVQLPGATLEGSGVTVVLFNGNFNHSTDIQGLLESVRPQMARSGRVVVVLYNWYFAWLFRLADRLGLRQGPPFITYITRSDLLQLAKLAGFELVRLRPVVYVPWHFFGIGSLLNAILPSAPGIRWLSLVSVAVLRPAEDTGQKRPSLTVVIAARNERGNIENALRRLPDFGAPTEVIFVEGHSSDGTWEEIQRVRELWDGRNGLRVLALQQQGKGKADAVRLGFSKASGDLLTILDADLTMPPEDLTRFYDAYRHGVADFVNGTRLVYPMEGEAMRFLNRLGNVFFAKSLSYVLDVPLGDSLCGTKLMTRQDYERFVRWRRDFGDFDPFGDFELLFPAAVLGTGIIDIPVYYRARTYGTTNIHRFRDGAILFRMTLIGLLRIKFGSLR